MVTSRDPVEALEYIRRSQVDLLLADVRMPGMDGFELILQVKQAKADLPVLVMTGYGSIETAIQALYRGVDGLILKPFSSTSALVQSVRQVIEDAKEKKEIVRSQALRPLFDVTELLLAETSPEKLHEQIPTMIHDFFRADQAGFFLHDGLNKCVIVDFRQKKKVEAVVGDQRQQLIKILSEIGKPVLVNVGTSDELLQVQNLMRETELSSFMFVPVQRENKISFCAARIIGEKSFSHADLETFVIFSRQATVAFENARLYSELKDSMRRVEESHQALVQAEKMAAVGRLVASIAHEINNPLQSVRNCLNLASRQELASDQYFRYLAMMDKELERLTQTIKQLLDYYRPKNIEQEVVDITQVVKHILDLLGPQLRDQGIQVHHHISGKEKSLVLVYPGQIEQVILNLLINAMDAVEQVDDSVKSHNTNETGKEIWIETLTKGSKVYVQIEDAGPGVPPGWQERKFEPFFSTKENGTGLGLTVCYTIMQKHKGSIDLVPATHGTGACFELIFPLAVRSEDGENIDRR